METVEVVISLSKNTYDYLKRHEQAIRFGGMCGYADIRYKKAILDGTVLPKGHDNLIDKGQLLRNVRKKAQEYDEPWKTNLGSVVEYFVAGCDVIIEEDWSDEYDRDS